MDSDTDNPTHAHRKRIHDLLKIITNIRVSQNARDVMALASQVFMAYVASVARAFGSDDGRTRVNEADIARALRELDFSHIAVHLPQRDGARAPAPAHRG